MPRHSKQLSKEEELLKILEQWRTMMQKYATNTAKQLNKIARLEIWKWYGSYTPREYNRKKTLYYAFKISEKDRVINYYFGSEYMYPIHHVDRINPSYIYENSFIEGYHGGAIDGPNHPHPGIPYWRTPAPHYPEWSYPAARNIPPRERIRKSFDKYIKKVDNKLTNEFMHKMYPQLMRIKHLSYD